MCGILFSCCWRDIQYQDPFGHCEVIRQRGPDGFGTIERTWTAARPLEKTICLTFSASVLSLRGSQVVLQPLQDDATGSLLCWNGEAWRIGDQLMSEGNDASAVFSSLLNAPNCGHGQHEGATDCSNHWRRDHVRNVLASIHGPFAFVFLDWPARRLYFGRDVLGRRSLVARASPEGFITIASVGCGTAAVQWKEIDSSGIIEVNLGATETPTSILDPSSQTLTTWRSIGKVRRSKVSF